MLKNKKAELLLILLLAIGVIMAGCSTDKTDQINDNSSISVEKEQNTPTVSEDKNKSTSTPSIEKQDVDSKVKDEDNKLPTTSSQTD